MPSMALLAPGAFRPELFQWRLYVLFVVSCCAALWGSWCKECTKIPLRETMLKWIDLLSDPGSTLKDQDASTHQNIASSYSSTPYHWTFYAMNILRHRYLLVTFCYPLPATTSNLPKSAQARCTPDSSPPSHAGALAISREERWSIH